MNLLSGLMLWSWLNWRYIIMGWIKSGKNMLLIFNGGEWFPVSGGVWERSAAPWPYVSAALTHSQTPTWLNSINPQRSLATFAPTLAPCFTKKQLCNGSLWKRRSADGAATLPMEAPRAPSSEVNRKVGPSDESCWWQLQTVGSTRTAAWLLNSERLSTLDTPFLTVND